jgi:hypothetical protein
MRKLLGTLALGVLSATTAGTAHAWGDDGHKIVGLIAQHYLDPAVQSQVNAMLANDGTGLVTPLDIPDEATWADKYRDSDRPSGPRYTTTHNWHYVDIELSAPNLDTACYNHPALPAGTPASSGPSNDCITDKIDQFRVELASAATPAAERLMALQFLLHFIGDQHQPLHASDDNDAGGNSKNVHNTTLGSGTLHGFWDTQFVHQVGTNNTTVANTLIAAITPAQITQWQQGTPEDWAQESFGVAESTAYGLLPAPDSSGTYQLSSSYVGSATGAVKTQLSRAGVRLAYVLNQALGSSSGGGSSSSSSSGGGSSSGGSSGGSQLLGNPGFENGAGSPAPWSASTGVINSNNAEPPHAGSYDAWLDGYGTTTTDTLQQTVSLPASLTTATFSFWLHVDTAETTTTTAYDTLKVQVLNSSGSVLKTLATYSNLGAASGYQQRSFDLSAYKGQTVTLKFTGAEDYTDQTSFVVDDTSLSVQ